jgi:lipopolysaccharide transport system permease protein
MTVWGLAHTGDVLRELVVRDFKLRYKRSLFGVAWSLLVPVAQLVVLYQVFHKILPLNVPHYTTFLFTGILPWTWLQTALSSGTGAIVDNRELVKEPGFPVAVLPAISVVTQMIHFLLAVPILFAFLWYDGYQASMALAALPAVIFVQFVFAVSIVYVLATLQVTFRDTQYLLGIVLFLAFYLTPVFYEAASVPADLRPIFRANPMATLLDAYRAILIGGRFPTPAPLLALTAVSLAVLWAGCRLFRRARERFVEEL